MYLFRTKKISSSFVRLALVLQYRFGDLVCFPPDLDLKNK